MPCEELSTRPVSLPITALPLGSCHLCLAVSQEFPVGRGPSVNILFHDSLRVSSSSDSVAQTPHQAGLGQLEASG